MNWLHSFWFNYEWPSIKGNGPEDGLATIALAALTVYLWPKVKRHFALIHAKLDHIIKHHPGIPPFEEKV